MGVTIRLRRPFSGRTAASPGAALGGGVTLVVGHAAAGGPPARTIDIGGVRLTVCRGPSGAKSDLPTLARDSLAALAAHERARVIDFVAEAASELTDAPHATAEGLALLNSLLRERLPEDAAAVASECLYAVDDRAFFVEGRLGTRDAELVRLTAVSPEGFRAELLPTLLRLPPVEAYAGGTAGAGSTTAFLAHFELPISSLREEGWIVEGEDDRGAVFESRLPKVVRDASAVQSRLLTCLEDETGYTASAFAPVLHPLLSRARRHELERLHPVDVIELGEPAVAPEVSVIVPLDERTQLVQHQLAQLALDADLPSLDLIYVLDAPEAAPATAAHASDCCSLYGISFRVAILPRRGGAAHARNVGASLARGRLLLFLDPDVLPDRPGWLSLLTAFYDATPELGALGAKLLYEDDTISAAGTALRRDAATGASLPAPRLRGMHRRFREAEIPRPVASVPATCLLVERDQFARAGGFDSAYAGSGCEDSDFCLRLARGGHENWYLPAVELYHLADTRPPTALERAALRHDQWLHARTHGEVDAAVERTPAARTPNDTLGIERSPVV